MNVLNRILMVLLILALLAAVVFLVRDPLAVAMFVQTWAARFWELLFVQQFYQYFLIGMGVLGLILLLLLWGELRRGRRKTVRIRNKLGKANLDVQSVMQSLEYRIDELAGVRKVHPKVVSRGSDVDVTIDLDTSPSVNVPVLTQQIMELCRDIVETQLGVKIHGKVQVNITHEPYPRGTMPSTGALAPEAVSLPPMNQTAAIPTSAKNAVETGDANLSAFEPAQPASAPPAESSVEGPNA